ncbi:MAG TPA: hypothetical protein VN956_25125 [Pyrinomonadaceae bacterium]|nr:hypothetical protein [Pyrinomonadaceae bacterium]
MATKKKTKSTSKKGRKTRLDLGDPPILVGGGGSVYVWIRLDDPPIPVNPGSNDPGTGIIPGSPVPRNRSSYSCSRVNRVYKQIIFFDGVDTHTLDIRNPRKFHVQFIQV